uniref:Uncharacterized protein n=1 Tax=Arundo donax TaxID=35708 RepID=A0A0A9C7X9_ARUDO
MFLLFKKNPSAIHFPHASPVQSIYRYAIVYLLEACVVWYYKHYRSIPSEMAMSMNPQQVNDHKALAPHTCRIIFPVKYLHLQYVKIWEKV